LPFLPKVFAGSGAVFAAGATFFFSLFDVVITSFSVVFCSSWFLPLSLVLLVQGYTLCAGTGIFTTLFGYFCDRGTETRRDFSYTAEKKFKIFLHAGIFSEPFCLVTQQI
jgi:hypothetical protein